MTLATSAQPKSTFCSVTPRKQKKFWVGNRRCDFTTSSASWWTRTWSCSRVKRRGSTSASCRDCRDTAATTALTNHAKGVIGLRHFISCPKRDAFVGGEYPRKIFYSTNSTEGVVER